MPKAEDSKKEASFGTTKNYLIGTFAGLLAGPLFPISPLVMGLIEKGKASKDWSTKTKWIAWGLTGVIICPISWGIFNKIAQDDLKRAEIAEKVDTLYSKKINDSNYIKANTELIALLHDACYSSADEDQCLKIDNTATILDIPQRDKLNSVLIKINQEIDNEKERQALEEARKKAEAEELRRQSIANGTYRPDEFEVGRPCKQIAEQNALTGRVDWGWFGNANSRWYPDSKTIVLEGRSKNAFGVKIPFRITCQWQKGGIVKMTGLTH